MLDKLSATARNAWEFADLPVSIVIPLYNEQRIIHDNLEALAGFFDRMMGAGNWLFILVDNGSTDATPQLVKAAIERWPLSKAIHLTEPNYGEALKVGLRSAATMWVYMLDIEQWDLPFMTWAWINRDHYEVFIASKRADPTLNHQHAYRRLLSAGLNGVLQLFFGFSGTDTHGPKLLNRQALDSIVHQCQLDRGQFDTELMLRAIRGRRRMVEVPMEYRESRPHRNWMVKKIVWNILALRRLQRVMRDVPFEGLARYYRFPREEVLAENHAALAESMEQDRV